MSCVKKYVKCPKSKRCRVKTGRCVEKQPAGDIKYTFAGKKFYVTPGKGQEELLEEEYGVTRRRSTRQTREPERSGVVTGTKYRRGMRRGIRKEESALSKKESSLIKKFKALDLDLQKELVSAPKEEFKLTIIDLDNAAGVYFPEVPFKASPTGMSDSELKLLTRLRSLNLPLGLPPSPLDPKTIKRSRMRTPDELDVRRFALLRDENDSDDDNGDEYIPALDF